MHLEVLVEDESGTVVVNLLLEKILGPNGSGYSWRMHPYKGIGRLPKKNLTRKASKSNRLLLNNLPSLLRGYGRSLTNDHAVIVVVDLDRKNCMDFKQDLLDLLDTCYPAPKALFRIAIEEIEAWLLGDIEAVKMAYPQAKKSPLNGYIQDSICGTWEVLADAVYKGGSARLKKSGYPKIGRVKMEWAQSITPHIEVERNISKSFQVFRDGIRRLVGHQQP